MKRAYIIYYNDQSANVVISSSAATALAYLSEEKLHKVSRVDLIPYEIL